MTTQIVTANRLDDGAVVYLDASGRWTETVGCARVVADADDSAALLRGAEEAVGLVTPYLIPVVVDGGAIRPAHIKEVIRATGPTTHPEFGKQTAPRTAAA